MKGYKFMMVQHVNGLLQGRARMCSLEYYRNLEGPDWIKDGSEGFAEVKLDLALASAPHEMRPERDKLSSLGIKIEHGGVGFRGCVVNLRAPPAYVFCFSLDPFEPARKAMCEDAPPDYRYDACVEIGDVERFCRAMVNGSINGTSLRDIFEGFKWDTVRYTKSALNFDQEAEFGVDPFLKTEQFSSQQEFRLMLFPKIDLPSAIFVDFVLSPEVLERRPV